MISQRLRCTASSAQLATSAIQASFTPSFATLVDTRQRAKQPLAHTARLATTVRPRASLRSKCCSTSAPRELTAPRQSQPTSTVSPSTLTKSTTRALSISTALAELKVLSTSPEAPRSSPRVAETCKMQFNCPPVGTRKISPLALAQLGTTVLQAVTKRSRARPATSEVTSTEWMSRTVVCAHLDTIVQLQAPWRPPRSALSASSAPKDQLSLSCAPLARTMTLRVRRTPESARAAKLASSVPSWVRRLLTLCIFATLDSSVLEALAGPSPRISPLEEDVPLEDTVLRELPSCNPAPPVKSACTMVELS